MNGCNPPEFLFAADDGASGGSERANSDPVYTIGELADRFGLTLRTLRFYERLGLLTPRREGRRRIYASKDADRLAAILRAKRLGFTLSETRHMIADEASPETLNLTREKCLEQIARLERQLAEIEEALAELRRISASF
jgi:DNA-binding transcriptional MerR regulator